MLVVGAFSSPALFQHHRLLCYSHSYSKHRPSPARAIRRFNSPALRFNKSFHNCQSEPGSTSGCSARSIKLLKNQLQLIRRQTRTIVSHA